MEFKMNEKLLYNIIAVGSLFLGFAVFVATFYEQLILGDMPCASCLITRQILLLDMMVCCMILKYGFRTKYIGFLLFLSALDLYISIRHSTFHWFVFEGTEGRFMEVHMYFWGFILDTVLIFVMGSLLLFFPNITEFSRNVSSTGRQMTLFHNFVFYLTVFLVVSNLILSFALVGPPLLKAPYPPVYWQWMDGNWFWNW